MTCCMAADASSDVEVLRGARPSRSLIENPDENGFPHKARLDFLDNRLDQGTGTLRARAVLANKAGLFSPGLFARVRVTGSPNYTAILVPDSAIGTDQTNKFVYIVGDDGTVARRNVKLGPWPRDCASCAKALRATTGWSPTACSACVRG